jgi:RNA polymerase sigma-70 factor (ECF subfamily)
MTCALDDVLSSGSVVSSCQIDSDAADVAVQRCLNRLARAEDEAGAGEIVRQLLTVAADHMLVLSRATLSRRYSRLTRGPLSVQPEDVLSAVVERLIKAMRTVRPTVVREFFALVMRHIRWELNGLARQLDAETWEPLTCDVIADESDAAEASEASVEQLSPRGRRILEAIESLPQTDREIFNLVRLNGMTRADAADTLGISTKTVQRRLKQIMPHLWAKVGELQPPRWALPQTDKTLQPRFVDTRGTTVEQLPRHVA